jgi:hypothetical protein
MQLLFQEKQGFNLLWCSLFSSPLSSPSDVHVRTHAFPLPYRCSMACFCLGFCGSLLFYTRNPGDYGRHYTPFFPLRQKHIPWSEVKKAHVREYLPLSEYGGWGAPLVHSAVYRGMGTSRALTTKGKEGLQLHLTDGRFLLIGTQKREELQRVLDKIKVSGSILPWTKQ